MENKKRNKKIAICIAILIVLLGGSFIIYKIARATDSNAVIDRVEIASIDVGDNTPETVQSFQKIKYVFNFDVKDSVSNADVENVTVNLRVDLSEEEKRFITISGDGCESESCKIRNVDSFGSHTYELTLNVNNAPNAYEIAPSFVFDVEENNNDEAVVLGKKTIQNENDNTSTTAYHYSFTNSTYSDQTLANQHMPTRVISSVTNETIFSVLGNESLTKAATYNEVDGRFITYLVGIKVNTADMAGIYFADNTISFNVKFSSSNGEVVTKANWIRLYDQSSLDGITPVVASLPYSGPINEGTNKYIKNPGSIIVTQNETNANEYTVTINNFNLLLDAPTLNADGSPVDSFYIATIALTNFSPRPVGDDQTIINNRITINNNINVDVQNNPTQASELIDEQSQDSTQTDISYSAKWYDENEIDKITNGAVSKGTTVKYITSFKNNKLSANQGLKETIKFDTDAYRVLSYNDKEDISIKIYCGNAECTTISSNDFEVKFVTGSFENTNYTVPTNQTSCPDITVLNKNQIQNLYGGPCITANAGVEVKYDKIEDAVKQMDNELVEVPITKVIVQTKDGVVLPDEATVKVIIKARVKNVSDLTKEYQATTVFTTSDYETLYYYAPQSYNIVSPYNSYLGDKLKIVNFTLRQNMNVENGKSRFTTENNETIIYKIETNLVDNNMNVGADDTWYIKEVRTIVTLPEDLEYIPDDNYITPTVRKEGTNTVLEYLLITSSDKIKANMRIPEIYFKARLNPTMTGNKKITVTSVPYGININGEIDTSIGQGTSAEIRGIGLSGVIGTMSIGESGSLIDRDGTIDYVLSAYNNEATAVNDYTIINVLPYSGDENGSDFSGTYSVKITANAENSVSNNNIKCTKVSPSSININNNDIWSSCGNITDDFVEGITAIKIENISIQGNSKMGDIVVSLKTKDNKASDKYNNRFIGMPVEYASNIAEASVINRTVSGRVFLDNTGDGIKDGYESYISEIPITLYKVNEGKLKMLADTVTDENGYYEFSNLGTGRYKIRAKYDVNKYDLTRRYGTEDTSKDSDAYLIDDDGSIEISDKSETSAGFIIKKDTSKIENMDVGLLPKHTFGFIMNKYITKIELANNGTITTNTYDNLSTVSLSVLNPKKYTTKVYYGISITNNSNRAGYVNLVKEDIPKGFIFDKTYPENAGWFEVDGMLGNNTLENTVVYPNDTVYLQIVLFLPARDEAGVFVNTASIAEISEYNQVIRNVKDQEYHNDNAYEIGTKLRYAGVNFTVINTVPDGNDQILTLLADADNTSMAHGAQGALYKWSTSDINYYLNTTWLMDHNLDSAALIGFDVCDDASGLSNPNSVACVSNIWTSSKVRLLTLQEEQVLRTVATNQTFLRNGGDFWLMDSVYEGESTNAYTKSKYVNTADADLRVSKKEISNSMKVRPVIRISSRNIILE